MRDIDICLHAFVAILATPLQRLRHTCTNLRLHTSKRSRLSYIGNVSFFLTITYLRVSVDRLRYETMRS